MTNAGLIINLEGSGCTGKTTAVTTIAERLRTMGYDPIVVTNHVIDDYTQSLRETLSQWGADVSELSKVCVYAAIWSHIQERIIEPARAENKIVLLDRWCATTYFFQAAATERTITNIFRSTGLTKTDLCLHLICSDLEVIEQRLNNRYERKDRYNNDFIRKSLVHMPEYIYGCQKTSNKHVSIDTGFIDVNAVAEKCMEQILPLLEGIPHAK